MSPVEAEILKGLRAGLAGDILNEQPERWNGVVQQDGNVGRTDVLAGVTVSYRLSSVTAALSVKTPVYQLRSIARPRGRPRLTYPVIIGLSVQTSFGGAVDRTGQGR